MSGELEALLDEVQQLLEPGESLGDVAGLVDGGHTDVIGLWMKKITVTPLWSYAVTLVY